MNSQTTVLEVGGLHWATSQSVVEKVLSHRPGVLAVQANAVAQTATVRYDPARTSVAELTRWVRDCGYHCAGQSVPDHVCDPMTEPGDAHHMHPDGVVDDHTGRDHTRPDAAPPMEHAAPDHARQHRQGHE
jgi:Cu2+-exporting ATPase